VSCVRYSVLWEAGVLWDILLHETIAVKFFLGEIHHINVEEIITQSKLELDSAVRLQFLL